VLERAREIADDVLFPSALSVDRSDHVPPAHLDLLAAEGFYGLSVRPDLDFAGFADVAAALASGCLTTAFVWLQHHGPARAAAETAWGLALASGQVRAGIGLAGIRHQKDPLRVRRTSAGFVLTGTVPWVTGWDMIDVVFVAALDESDVVHFLLVDALAGPTLKVGQPDIVAVAASRTVNVRFLDHEVVADRLISTVPFADWSADDSRGATLNGFLSLGLVDRCVRLLCRGPGATTADALARAATARRADLLAAPPDQLNAARAGASDLAWRAAGAVCVATGAPAVLLDQHGQRLAREAAFLLVFGSRPQMRDVLLGHLAPAD
jgi:alkylation response protein AidB-like acyl-CoA dehydrogenase